MLLIENIDKRKNRSNVLDFGYLKIVRPQEILATIKFYIFVKFKSAVLVYGEINTFFDM